MNIGEAREGEFGIDLTTANDGRIEELYKRHGHDVYRRCYALLGHSEDAHDALHEVFVKIIISGPRFEHDRPIMAWVNRVTTNYCLNRLRARKYRRHMDIEAVEHIVDNGASAFIVQLTEDRDLIRWLVLPCDERTQLVVVAYFFDEQAVADIATELNISIPTVRRVLKGFLVKAKAMLERLAGEQQQSLQTKRGEP